MNKPLSEIAMSAKEKTESLIRTMLPIDSLEAQDINPNEMDEAEFNLLYDNIEKAGCTDPLLVRPKRPEEITPEKPATHKIVGGYHRWEVCKLHALEEVPVTIITDPEFDADMEKFQIVRHNIIRGKMNPKKFMSLYQSLQGKYAEDVAAELFGFAEEEEFRKLVSATANSLPPEMKQAFKEASKEIKTIDDLTILLNRLFSNYGDTIPYGFMVFDFGGQDHIWLRMKHGQKKEFYALGDLCRENGVAMDGVVTAMVQLIAQKNEAVLDALAPLIADLPTLDIPDSVSLPTLEALDSGNAADLL